MSRLWRRKNAVRAGRVILTLEGLEERSVPSVTTVDFDHDVDGNTIVAPPLFAQTNPLREIYSSFGVHFSGPATADGGAILDQDGNFGVPAHSGRNFLAFNRNAQMANGGIPRDPETIRFDTPPAQVTIYAAGGVTNGYFEMDAFDRTGTLVAVNTVTTRDWSPLRVVYTGGIDHVVLTASNLPQGYWVYDDLSFGDVSGVDSGDAGALASAANFRGALEGVAGGVAVNGAPATLPTGVVPSGSPAALNPAGADAYSSNNSPNQAASASASHALLGQGELPPQALLPSMVDLNSNLATGL